MRKPQKIEAKTSKQKRGRGHRRETKIVQEAENASPETVAPRRYESDAIFNNMDNREKFWEIKNERSTEKRSRKLER